MRQNARMVKSARVSVHTHRSDCHPPLSIRRMIKNQKILLSWCSFVCVQDELLRHQMRYVIRIVSISAMTKNSTMKTQEWNGISRESQYHDEANSARNCTPTLLHGPLNARGELQSHPLAGEAHARGPLTQAEGSEGPIAPVVTTGSSKKRCAHQSLDHVHEDHDDHCSASGSEACLVTISLFHCTT